MTSDGFSVGNSTLNELAYRFITALHVTHFKGIAEWTMFAGFFLYTATSGTTPGLSIFMFRWTL